jgi:hypothetical protein
MSTRIYVGNLPLNVTAEALQTLFSPYGVVDTVNLITDRETGGYAASVSSRWRAGHARQLLP